MSSSTLFYPPPLFSAYKTPAYDCPGQDVAGTRPVFASLREGVVCLKVLLMPPAGDALIHVLYMPDLSNIQHRCIRSLHPSDPLSLYDSLILLTVVLIL